VEGIRGIGNKTAATLIASYGDIPTLLQNIDNITPTRIRNIINDHQKQIQQNYEQIKLQQNLKLPIAISSLSTTTPDNRAVHDNKTTIKM